MQGASLRDKIRGMNMKIMTVLAVASLAISGAACSESKTKTSPDAVAVDSAAGGTLNLSLPSTINDAESTGGTLNLNLGGVSADEPRLIGSDQLNGVDFNGVPGPALATEPEDVPADDGGDDIIRLQPN